MNEIENILKRVRDTKALEFGVGAMKKNSGDVRQPVSGENGGRRGSICLYGSGAPYEPEMIGVSREKLRKTFRAIPFMRDRFTGIDLIYRAGLMDEVEAYLFGKGGIYEC